VPMTGETNPSRQSAIALRQKALRFSSTSKVPDSIADRDSRYRKAQKIRRVLSDAGGLPRPAGRLLDVGCSFGYIAEILAADVRECFGIDLDLGALREARRCNASMLSLAQSDAERLPFRDACFDVVVCSHVYEHTPSAPALMAEIRRVLRPEGVCYFGAPNRFELVEPHYRLPLLGWLPGPLADRYVRLSGRGSGYPERPYSLPGLRRLVSGFEVMDWTEKVVADPALYHVEDILPPGSAKQWIAKTVLKALPWLFPDFIFVLRKARPAPGARNY
jgi:SAM-dependent methyltransferase